MRDWQEDPSYFDVSTPPGIDERFDTILISLQGDVPHITPSLGFTSIGNHVTT